MSANKQLRHMRSAIAMFLVAFTCKATALTCDNPTVSERLRANSYALLVEIVAARIEQSEGFPDSIPGKTTEDITVSATRREPLYRRVRASVRVLESYKGADPPTELVFTELGAHPEVAVGAMYLVFADGPDVPMDCGGALRISLADPESIQMLQALRSLRE